MHPRGTNFTARITAQNAPYLLIELLEEKISDSNAQSKISEDSWKNCSALEVRIFVEREHVRTLRSCIRIDPIVFQFWNHIEIIDYGF